MVTTTQAPLPADVESAPAATDYQKPKWSESSRFQGILHVTLVRILIWAIIIVVMFPVVYVLATSFKADGRSLNAATLFPREYTLDLYKQLLSGDSNFLRWVGNSLILGLSAGVAQVV